MKIRQTVQHFAAKKALTLPLVGEKVRAKLVEMHTRIFLERASEERRDERRAHLDAFFEATMDIYLAALDDGFTEAEAREITHILANVELYRLGWVEMLELPASEIAEDFCRYEAFFEAHAITPERPLGTFEPETDIPEAPATPELREQGESPFAEAGYGGALYVEDAEGNVRAEQR